MEEFEGFAEVELHNFSLFQRWRALVCDPTVGNFTPGKSRSLVGSGFFFPLIIVQAGGESDHFAGAKSSFYELKFLECRNFFTHSANFKLLQKEEEVRLPTIEAVLCVILRFKVVGFLVRF